MTLEDDLKAALKGIFSTASMAQMPAQQAKIYEVWILFKLAEGLKKDGWSIELRGHDDKSVIHFLERGAPGFIHPKTANAPKPSFVLLTRPRDNRQFELHNSVRFLGRSRALHEFDVSLIARSIGDSLRAAPKKRAAQGHPMLTIECKYYAGHAGIDVPREAIGALFDATHWARPALFDQSALDGHVVKQEKRLADRLDHTFAAVTSPQDFTGGAQRLAREYHLRLYPKVTINSANFGQFLADAKQWLRSYAG
jgi:hypothetical protein